MTNKEAAVLEVVYGARVEGTISTRAVGGRLAKQFTWVEREREVGEILEFLEEEGLVTSRPGPGKQVLWSITDGGRRMAQDSRSASSRERTLEELAELLQQQNESLQDELSAMRERLTKMEERTAQMETQQPEITAIVVEEYLRNHPTGARTNGHGRRRNTVHTVFPEFVN